MTHPIPTFASQDECEAYLKALVANNAIIPRKTPLRFAINEVFSFLAQFLVFFLGIVLTTNALRDEKRLMATLASKAGEGATQEFFWLGLAILAVVGILGMVANMAEGAKPAVDEFMLEFPKAIYAFTASGAAAFVAVERFLQLNPQERVGNSSAQLIMIALGLALVGLLYGGALSFMLRRKDYIK
ncbi:hypothetical protein CR152_15560 [Massilia violaceinigra]|uniref:Uncharacterized protein n=1 Tax=Massilia violaceinigra TaxID=2045208 RepID=A0A2D2DLC8_9BURK|nr:hypothetical protein [Massilia violaceinigra]ATQ75784.1 hypothetical protein CR152_15560 [Massilia violaceinigra]